MNNVSNLNIKRKRSARLRWGFNTVTRTPMHISQIHERGACGCVCPVCGGDLSAKLGHKNINPNGRVPHFAHKCSDDCLYGNEIAEYYIVKTILEKADTLRLPDEGGEEKYAKLAGVSLSYTKSQYPPLLTATLDGTPVRIILCFDGYYKLADLQLFMEEACAKKWWCLGINRPDPMNSTPPSESAVIHNHRDSAERFWICGPRRKEPLPPPEQQKPAPPKPAPVVPKPASATMTASTRAENEKTLLPIQIEKYRAGYADVCGRNPEATLPVHDRFRRRWYYCVDCKDWATVEEMAAYEGVLGPIKGVCKNCHRERIRRSIEKAKMKK